jgi:uncharacterized protein
MDILLICTITLIGAALTLFSGFGLGTLLMPVFGLFFPIDLAIAMTAIVHFSNNLIKLGFYHRTIDWRIVVKFGIPSIFAAFLGAWLLTSLTHLQPFLTYSFNDHLFSITPIKSTIAVLLVIFALIELIPSLSQYNVDQKYLPLGGLLSGFFGGLSGNQGALRSAFLVRVGLSKEFFIGTGVFIACMIDITRLSIYSKSILGHLDQSKITLLVLAVVSAFIGVYFGNKLVKKVTIRMLKFVVALMLLLFAIILGFGIV